MTRFPRRNARSNENVLAAFVSKKTEIDAKLARLQAISDDHFGVAPNEVTWGDVGSLEHYAELLKRITDSAFDEGDHAASAAQSPAPNPRGSHRRGSDS